MSPTGPAYEVHALRHHPDHPGAVVRAARIALRWSQAELGRRCGYSASQVSRWETGRLPLRDIDLLHTLAEVLSLPHAAFGLVGGDTAGRASHPQAGLGHKVGRATSGRAEEDDPVRRRAFLQLTAVAGSTLAWPGSATAHAATVDPAALLADQLGTVVLGPRSTAAPALPASLRNALAVARREFAACRYTELAERLPLLLTAAEATAADRPDPAIQQLLAESYNLATRALIKLEPPAWNGSAPTEPSTPLASPTTHSPAPSHNASSPPSPAAPDTTNAR